MNPIDWLLSLTDHELNVIATVFSVIASSATATGVAAAIYARLARRDARTAMEQTRRTEWHDGKQYHVSVSEDTNQAVHQTRDLRAELLGPRTHGRRRDTLTNPVRTGKETDR